jgi:2-polyprenyl-6-hydroxyphenyl methylase / 3-demethylubiquinone-9 3-methyltransferase
MTQKELHGGSMNWWPPKRDHILLYKANPVRFEYFKNFINSWKGVKVLDVGCGGGYACEYLAQRKAVVFGTDILAESLQEAGKHALQSNLEIEYRLCTSEQLPFSNQTMDVVTCFDVLEHVPDKGQMLSEINRVLKPDGWLFFDTVNKTFWSKLGVIWLCEILLRFIPRGTHHWPLFINPDDLKGLLETAKLVSTEIAGLRFDWHMREKGGLPVAIASQGNTAVIYFGAARKSVY